MAPDPTPPRGREPKGPFQLPGFGGKNDAPGWKVHPAADGRGAPTRSRMPRPRFWPIVIALLIVNYWIASTLPDKPARAHIAYSPQFLHEVQSSNVSQVTITEQKIEGEFKKAVKVDKKRFTRFETNQPALPTDNTLLAQLKQQGVEINAKSPDSGRSLLASILLGFGPTLLILGIIIFAMRRATAGGGALGTFGRSKARRYEGTERVTFADVAGIEEAEQELVEVVDFLKNPEKYSTLGGKIPRGVLLSGPPGTGKTLLARAVAGEAGVPFFSASASEFVEMIVGVGASRVRDLFAQAKAAQPAIVFIDELDAIGRSRGGGASFGGHDEREQTLNQILTEMDGFSPNSGVIVLAATNRPDVLDKALLRPGRFDRRVSVQPPDRQGRLEILRVHTRSVPLAPDVDLGAIASTTPGMVGADLANLVNEAALLAARRSHKAVEMADLTDAVEKIVLGVERRVMMTHEDRERTAYHEAGHALVGMLIPAADPVRKVSIIPRGMALGVTFSAPDSDRFNYDEAYLKARLRVALGGRVAEELVFNSISSGAESDIQQMTAIARQMVGRWGMSAAIGPVAVLPAESDGPLLPGVAQTSEDTQRLVDSEVRRLADEAHADATALLTRERARLDSLTKALLEAETLDEAAAYAAAGVPHTLFSPPGEPASADPPPIVTHAAVSSEAPAREDAP
ncbi:MAG: cell division protease FtsH [Gaiellales bacterium]|jgi:cell division protease FtsH|nr:cell division protease FtsH [Gaiellales bacterium]